MIASYVGDKKSTILSKDIGGYSPAGLAGWHSHNFPNKASSEKQALLWEEESKYLKLS